MLVQTRRWSFLRTLSMDPDLASKLNPIFSSCLINDAVDWLLVLLQSLKSTLESLNLWKLWTAFGVGSPPMWSVPEISIRSASMGGRSLKVGVDILLLSDGTNTGPLRWKRSSIQPDQGYRPEVDWRRSRDDVIKLKLGFASCLRQRLKATNNQKAALPRTECWLDIGHSGRLITLSSVTVLRGLRESSPFAAPIGAKLHNQSPISAYRRPVCSLASLSTNVLRSPRKGAWSRVTRWFRKPRSLITRLLPNLYPRRRFFTAPSWLLRLYGSLPVRRELFHEPLESCLTASWTLGLVLEET